MTDKQKTWYWMKCIPWVMKYSFRWMLLEHSVSEKREYSHTNTFCDISVGVLLCLLTSSLKKHAFYKLLINNILYLCVT